MTFRRIKRQAGVGGGGSRRSTPNPTLSASKERRGRGYKCLCPFFGYAGHVLDDEHFEANSRTYSMRELAGMVHPALKFRLDVAGLKTLLKPKLGDS